MFTKSQLTRASKFAALTVCLVASFSLVSRAQATYSYRVENVMKDIYLLEPTINDYRWVTSNIVVIVNEKDVLVVDSGLLPEAGAEAIKEIKKITNKPVKFLLNTHWHGDHWQGNGAFVKAYPGISIIATDQGLKGIQENGMVWARRFYIKYFQDFYVKKYETALVEKKLDDQPLNEKQLDSLRKGTAELKQDIESMKQLQVYLPNMTYTDKMVITSGERVFEFLYLGIGNTSGDAVLYLPKEKVVIAGDLVVYPSPYESGMFSPEWLETSLKLAALDYNTLIPGHGKVQRDHHYLNFLNALYSEIIKQVHQAYANGTSGVEEFKKVVTHETVTRELNKTPEYQTFAKGLDPSFVPGAITTSFRRIMQGKK